tara:strand:+ start:1086 stop:3752 length:2667 start_codon:yes stop_codon:yes gene_type:complete
MATYYIDWEGGDDSRDGTSFANRTKTQYGLASTSMTGGDEVRFAGKPRQLLDSSARIWNYFGWRPYRYYSVSTITYSTTTGQTNINWSGHGMQTGETVAIDQNSNFTNHWETINGIWEVTVVDANNFKLNDYTAPSGASSGSGGYIRKMKSSIVQLSSEVTKEIASNGQRTGPWTASSNVTCTLETSTGTWSSQLPFQSHAYSDKIEIADGFGTGKAAYWGTGSLNLSGYQQISYLVRQNSGTRTNTGTGTTLAPNISLRLCTDTSGDTSVHTIPIITGADSSNTWRDFTHDFGTNLNSGIQSIALYVDSDNGAQSFNFDNIIACKAKSAADSLTLNSIVGLGTQPNCPQYFKISSIRKKNIRLLLNDRHYSRYPWGYYSPGGVDWDGGVGIARTANTYQTVNMYKIEPSQIWEDCKILPNSSSWGNFSPNYFNFSSKSGISTTNRIKFSGGWDVSNSMSTKHTGGYSALNAHNSYGYLMTFSSCSYAEFSDFIGVSALQNIQFSSCNYSKFDNIGGVAGGYYSITMSSCNYLLGGCNLWGSLGQYALQLSSCSNWNDYKDQNVGLTTFTFGPSLGEGIYMSSCNNSDIHKLNVKQGAQSYILNIYNCKNSKYHYIDCGDAAQGGSTSYGLRINNCNGVTVGIATLKNTYYSMQNQNSPDVVFDRLDVIQEDWQLSNGANGTTNVQYAMYNNTNARVKVLGGTWDRMPYLNGSDVLTDNVVFNDTSNPQFGQPNRLLCKNYDGNSSGEYRNFYQYGTVNPDTSTRHTASGFSWKIDIDSSTATSGAPVEWELAKVICNANAQVTASIWVYRDGTGVNGGIRVKPSAIGGVGSSNIDAVISDTTINSWVQVSLNFTPNEAGTCSIYAMGYYVSGTSHNVWLDDFSVTQA